jgi:hypothetical protein
MAFNPAVLQRALEARPSHDWLGMSGRIDARVAAEQKRQDEQAARRRHQLISQIIQQHPDDPDAAIKVLRPIDWQAADELHRRVLDIRKKESDLAGQETERLYKQGLISEQQAKAAAAAYQRGALEDWVEFFRSDPERAADAQRRYMGPQEWQKVEDAAAQRDLTARGQDISAATAAAGQAVTARGQDITAATTRRGQDISAATARRGQDISGAAATGGADDSMRNLAAMVARSPDMLQSVTPTVAGALLKTLASDPELLAQYEQTRLAPLRGQTQTLLSALQRLITVPLDGGEPQLTSGAKAIFGAYTPVGARAYIPGPAATDANAALSQVLGQQIVKLIADMKAQSKTGATGFGQLSLRELDVLQSAATQLTQRLSEPAALRELKTLYDSLQKIMQPGTSGLAAPGANAPGAVVQWERGPDGRPRRVQP